MAAALPPVIEPNAKADPWPSEYPFLVHFPERPQFTEVHGSTEHWESVNLGTLFDGRFRVLKAIPVVIETHPDSVAAVWREIDEFGLGNSASAACVELGKSIAELYATLKREERNLGPDLERVWSILKQHVRPTVVR